MELSTDWTEGKVIYSVLFYFAKQTMAAALDAHTFISRLEQT